jgi:hypothetical protein
MMIRAALVHNIFELLETPRTLSELQALTKASNRGLRILLDGLLGLGLLLRPSDRYANSPDTSAFLVPGKPAFQGSVFLHAFPALVPKWLELPEVVKTGTPAIAVNRQEQGEHFYAGMVEALFPMSYFPAKALAKHLDLRALTKPITILDIGAGSGVWGIALAEESSKITLHSVDWPAVLAVAERFSTALGLAGRFVPRPGDIASVDFGAGHQIVTLGHIIHSEGEAGSRKLLAKSFEALSAGGTIVIVEFIANEDRSGPPHALLFAVSALVDTEHGDIFTFNEMSTWLRDAGFKNIRLLDIPGVAPLILADKP